MTLEPVAYQPYADPDEFIREVTDRIWVERDIDHIVENYEENSIVHGGLGTTVGREGVIHGTTMRIATLPHRVGQAEDVVWEQRGTDAFLSSHLVFSSNEHITDGRKRGVRSRTIANCLYRRGRMVEEWVVRDTLASALQNGIHPDEAAAQVRFLGFQPSWTEPPPEDPIVAGDSGPRPDVYREECKLVLGLLDEVWSKRRLNRLGDFIDRDTFLHTVGDRTVIRPDGYQRDLLELVAPFPDATFVVRDLQTNDATRYGGLRVAALWQMRGTYTGVPTYGPPTGSAVDLLGISQFLFHRGRIVREFRVYDEIAFRAQIAASREGTAGTVAPNIY